MDRKQNNQNINQLTNIQQVVAERGVVEIMFL